MNPLSSHKSYATVRLVAARLGTEIAQLAPNWKWRVDGVATAAVLLVLILDRTSIKVSAAGPWMNVVAIFCVGFVVQRTLGCRRQTGQRSPGLLRRIITSRRSRG
ncbi:hypothetical protein P3T23_009220 [Paraburkholderia sp. GAS448]|uniref:hypothetical protein n=1 Tax=Paraburkholderia sp. GAS448 TaxID=3035136 RepID=UPI003D1F4F5C